MTSGAAAATESVPNVKAALMIQYAETDERINAMWPAFETALKAAGARDARYTEFPDANHNSWDATYAYAPMWDWLFAQRRGR